jgi:hypothetical protein
MFKLETMIQIITNLPANVAGFRASGEVTKDDYQNVVEPHVKSLVEKTGELNFLLKLDTDVKNFTAGAWLSDLSLGIKHLTKWNRAAIVSDSDAVINFTDGFSYLAPGEFKGFKKSEFEDAVNWVSA